MLNALKRWWSSRPVGPVKGDRRIIRNAVDKYLAQIHNGVYWCTVDSSLVAKQAYDHDWWFNHMTCTSEQQAHERLNNHLSTMHVVGTVWSSPKG